METKTESGWQGTEVYLKLLSIIWEKNLNYYEGINESRDVDLVLKTLSDLYYGLRSLKSVLSYFLKSDKNASAILDKLFNEIKEETGDKEIIQCSFTWQQIYKVRNTLINIQDEMFIVLGTSKLLVPINTRKIYDTMYEELEEENS
jgi:hypothetical protein